MFRPHVARAESRRNASSACYGLIVAKALALERTRPQRGAAAQRCKSCYDPGSKSENDIQRPNGPDVQVAKNSILGELE